MAKEVEVEASGQRREGDVSVWTESDNCLLGMKFLKGATFQFEEDGTWGMSFPEAEVRAGVKRGREEDAPGGETGVEKRYKH